jgi:phospholipase/carboxylesterase
LSIIDRGVYPFADAAEGVFPELRRARAKVSPVREETPADLRVVLTGGTDRNGGGDGPLVVLLHGFGAPGTDLVPLWRQLDVPHEVRFAFPQAPLDLGELIGPGYAGGRAWWMIDIDRLAAAAAGVEREDRSNEVPEGLASARDRVIETLDALETQLGVPRGEVVLGGFSQGAMLALDVALRTERPLAGLALLSTTLLCRHEWVPLMPRRAGTPVLMSHGRSDPLLPFAAAERLRDLLADAGLAVRWHPFNGGHGISEGAVEELAKLVRDTLGS